MAGFSIVAIVVLVCQRVCSLISSMVLSWVISFDMKICGGEIGWNFIWLVVYLPIWKIMNISWDDFSFPTEWKVIKAMFQTTNQLWLSSMICNDPGRAWRRSASILCHEFPRSLNMKSKFGRSIGCTPSTEVQATSGFFSFLSVAHLCKFHIGCFLTVVMCDTNTTYFSNQHHSTNAILILNTPMLIVPMMWKFPSQNTMLSNVGLFLVFGGWDIG